MCISLAEGEDVQERRAFQMAAKKSAVAPSSFALASEFQATQKKEMLLCGRPPEMRPDIPVSLLCEIFGDFQCDVETIEPTREDCEFAVHVAATMAKSFSTENSRRDEFREIFWPYISSVCSLPGMQYMPIAIPREGAPDLTTDGSLVWQEGNSWSLLLNVEVKREKEDRGDGYLQNVKYYSAFWSHMGDSQRWKEDRCPSFLVELSGNILSVSGAVWGKHACISPLTDLVYLLGFNLPHDAPSLTRLARVGASLRKGLVALQRYYQSLPVPAKLAKETIEREICSMYPYMDRYFCEEERREIAFVYQRVLERNKLLFLVETEEGRRMVVKFCRRYSVDAHRLCAEQCRAPRLESVKELAGGWRMIVMEYVEATPLSSLRSERGWNSERIVNQVKECIARLHDCGYVHGDLRDNNILVADGNSGILTEAVVIDFDWAGRSGVDRYPLFMNHAAVKWPDGAADGEYLQKEHDIEWISRLERWLSSGQNS